MFNFNYQQHRSSEQQLYSSAPLCDICQNSEQPQRLLALSECGHLHHPACLVDWLEQKHMRSACPTCSTPVVLTMGFEERMQATQAILLNQKPQPALLSPTNKLSQTWLYPMEQLQKYQNIINKIPHPIERVQLQAWLSPKYAGLAEMIWNHPQTQNFFSTHIDNNIKLNSSCYPNESPADLLGLMLCIHRICEFTQSIDSNSGDHSAEKAFAEITKLDSLIFNNTTFKKQCSLTLEKKLNQALATQLDNTDFTHQAAHNMAKAILNITTNHLIGLPIRKAKGIKAFMAILEAEKAHIDIKNADSIDQSKMDALENIREFMNSVGNQNGELERLHNDYALALADESVKSLAQRLEAVDFGPPDYSLIDASTEPLEEAMRQTTAQVVDWVLSGAIPENKNMVSLTEALNNIIFYSRELKKDSNDTQNNPRLTHLLASYETALESYNNLIQEQNNTEQDEEQGEEFVQINDADTVMSIWLDSTHQCLNNKIQQVLAQQLETILTSETRQAVKSLLRELKTYSSAGHHALKQSNSQVRQALQALKTHGQKAQKEGSIDPFVSNVLPILFSFKNVLTEISQIARLERAATENDFSTLMNDMAAFERAIDLSQDSELSTQCRRCIIAIYDWLDAHVQPTQS